MCPTFFKGPSHLYSSIKDDLVSTSKILLFLFQFFFFFILFIMDQKTKIAPALEQKRPLPPSSSTISSIKDTILKYEAG